MLKHIKNWWKDNALIVAIGISLSIIALSLISVNVIPSTRIKVSDKFLHAFAYFILIWSWMVVFREKKTLKSKLLLIITLTILGIILEALQGGITNYRTADFYDVVANTIGIILATLLFSRFIKSFNTI